MKEARQSLRELRPPNVGLSLNHSGPGVSMRRMSGADVSIERLSPRLNLGQLNRSGA